MMIAEKADIIFMQAIFPQKKVTSEMLRKFKYRTGQDNLADCLLTSSVTN